MSELPGGVVRLFWGADETELTNIIGLRLSKGKNITDITVLQDNKIRQLGILQNIAISLRLVFSLAHLQYLEALLENDFVKHKLWFGNIEVLNGLFTLDDLSFQIDKEGLILIEVSLQYGGEAD